MKTFVQVLLVSTVFVTAVQTAAAIDSVTSIIMTPASPAYRLHNERVDYTFKYATSNAGGVLIFGIPYTKGMPSPNYAHGGSPTYPVGNGTGSGYFRITSGDVRVDQLYLYMTTPDQSKKLFETYIDINYRYMDYNIRNVHATPASPATLANGEDINVTFDYSSKDDNVQIFVRPYTDGHLTPNYSGHGSAYYSSGHGSGSGYFTISTGDVNVDQFYFYIWNGSQKLYETFVNVNYDYAGFVIRDVVFAPASPATLAPGGRIDISFDYFSKEDNVLIFARPFTNGSLTPNYAADGSPDYPAGHGSGTAWFEILSPNLHVDAVRFEIKKQNPKVIYYTEYVPVSFRYCDGKCIWRVDEDAPGGNTGHTWYNAFNYLQDALDVAQAGDEIWVAEGTYYPDEDILNPDGTNNRSATFAMIAGVNIYGGFNGTETDRSERNWVTHETVLSGNIGNSSDSDNSYHVVTCNIGGSNTAVLDGFQIVEGNADGGTFPQWIGAGLYLNSGEPFVQNCLFRNNKAEYGAGIADWSFGQPQINSCWFIENHADSRGGGIDIQHSGAVLRGCMFLANSADSGGGLYAINNASRPELYSCVFSGNTATYAGGAIRQAATDGDNEFAPALFNCTLAYNSTDGNGGGISNSGTTDISLNSVILWENTDSSGSGQGSQYVTVNPNPSIRYSCIQGWNGTWGGIGNIGLNPMFIDADGIDNTIGTPDDNYRLMEGSPCINTGDPAVSMNDPDGSRNDMGAYGGPWADLSVGPGSIPGSGFVFTTIGDLPTAFIEQSDSNPSQLQGTANVPGPDAANFGIPAYSNTPFGSSIRIRGMFGADDPVEYYKVQAAMWDGDTPPENADFFDLTDTLYKTLSYYFEGEWHTVSMKIGPQTVEGVQNVYTYTDSGFWSNLDLRMIWNTRNRPNGKYTLRIKGYDRVGSAMNDVTPGNAQELIVLVDNSPVTAVIHNVKYDPTSPYYNPLTDGEILECGIVSLESAQENLRFTVTASHPGGHLRSFTLDAIAGKNDHRGTIAAQSYNPALGVLWPGVTEQEYGSEDALPPAGSLQDWKRCAYQFRLRAWANVTNGYNYIYWQEFSDHYFIDLGGMTPCQRADIDDSGTVDLLDLAEMANQWLKTCNAAL